MKTIKGDKNMKSTDIKSKECLSCEGQGGNQTDECPECKGTGYEIQTWPWDTIVLMNPRETGKDLTIPGTDIEVIYDREAKVYRRIN